MNVKKGVLSIDGIEYTPDDIANFIGVSDSEDSVDWGDIQEIKEEEFCVTPSIKEKVNVKENKRIKPSVETKYNVATVVKELEQKPLKSKAIEQMKMPKSINQKLIYFVATPTNMRVMNCRLSVDTWRERIAERQVVPASNLCMGNTAERLVDSDWILVGVIAQKSGTKKTKSDKNYSMWMLNDLQCLDKAVRFMLFGEVHESLWKESEGTVVAVLRPKLMQSDKGYSEKSYTVDISAQVIVLGQSPDYGICEGRKKTGDKCTNIVNKAHCGLCSFHIRQGYSAATNRPGFTDIRQEKLESRKRVAPSQEWQLSSKKQKSNGIFVNNVAGTSSLSMDKLHRMGVTESAAKWGLLDGDAVSKLAAGGTEERRVALSEKEEKFATMLKKPGAGSLNLVKCIAEKSVGGSILGEKVVRKGRVFDNGRPTVGKDVTFQSILERIKGREVKRDDPQRYIELDMRPVALDKVSGEVYRAELNKLRAAALAKSMGGYAQLKESNLAQHFTKVGQPTKVADKAKKPLSEEMLKLLRQGSAHSTLATLEKDMAMDRRMDNLERIEKMELKMASIHEQPCTYFYCNQCRTKSLGNPRICVEEGHQVDRVKGFKRFFACLKCKHRLMTLEKYPDESCYKCGAAVFEKTGMHKEKEVTEEKVKIDGGEKRFINN